MKKIRYLFNRKERFFICAVHTRFYDCMKHRIINIVDFTKDCLDWYFIRTLTHFILIVLHYETPLCHGLTSRSSYLACTQSQHVLQCEDRSVHPQQRPVLSG